MSYVDVKDGGTECVTVEGLTSAVVYLQSLTDQWVSIRSVSLKFGFVYRFPEFGFEIYGFVFGFDVCMEGLIFHVMF